MPLWHKNIFILHLTILTDPQDCLFLQKVDLFESHLQDSLQLLLNVLMEEVMNLGGGHSMSSDQFGQQQTGTTTNLQILSLTSLPSSAPMSGSPNRTDSMHIGWTTRPGSWQWDHNNLNISSDVNLQSCVMLQSTSSCLILLHCIYISQFCKLKFSTLFFISNAMWHVMGNTSSIYFFLYI